MTKLFDLVYVHRALWALLVTVIWAGTLAARQEWERLFLLILAFALGAIVQHGFHEDNPLT